MAMPYNFTNIANQTTIDQLFLAVHTDISGGWMGPLILITFFFILLVSFKGFESKDAFTGASFIGLIMGIFLNILGVVPVQFVIVFLFLSALGAIFMVRGK